MIIGLIGLINSGKGTVGSMLTEQGFQYESFANSLKDAAAGIFNWDRAMLEGDTSASRVWRETVDEWWNERLKIPDFTPRVALQILGTDILRNHFHADIWVLSMEARIKDAKQNVVITDVRFPNEVRIIRELGGKIVRIKRGDDPEWFSLAASDHESMPVIYPNVHASEYSWAGTTPDYLIDNKGTIGDLREIVNDLLEDLRATSQ
jgi:hypothetical protein